MSDAYYMINYIHESAESLRRTLEDNEKIIEQIADRVVEDQIHRVVICGAGSSFTAAMMSGPIFRYHSLIPVHILSTSDLPYYTPRLINKNTLVVAVSRSGERGQVVNALKEAADQGALCVGMTGASDSLLAQSGHLTLLTREGPEITFPKTKSVTACAGLLMRLALALAKPEDEEARGRLKALYKTPIAIQSTMAPAENMIRGLIPEFLAHKRVIVSGTLSNYGVALEAVMKIQETAYIETHANDTGNLLHSALGVINAEWLAALLITKRDLELSKRALGLIGEFGAHRLSIVEPGLDLGSLSEYVLTLPERVDPFLAALVYLLPVQLIAYLWAVAQGLNPDAPASMHTTLAAILAPGRKEPEL